MMCATPNEVRGRMCHEHGVIRDRLRSVNESLRDAVHEPDRPGSAPRLVRATMELCSCIEQHLDYEDDALAPLLYEVDAWGEVRAACLDDDHHAQRAVLVALTEDVQAGARSTRELTDEIAWFVNEVEHDLLREERVYLADGALGDSFIVTDQSDG